MNPNAVDYSQPHHHHQKNPFPKIIDLPKRTDPLPLTFFMTQPPPTVTDDADSKTEDFMETRGRRYARVTGKL